MQISVILSTYNQPEWLAKTLWGYACQQRRPLEIVIADDGSTDSTRKVIDDARDETGLKLVHVWHKDDGFRKTRILNRALEAANGDYLVFSDGDCIPRGDYLSVHAHHAQAGRFISSGAVRLALPASQAVTQLDVATQRCFTTGWVAKQSGAPVSQRLKMWSPGVGPWLFDHLTTSSQGWNGNNAACWKADAIRTGGFDERMQYGGEDREFGERLVNLGLRPKMLRYRAVLLHLDHGRGYVAPDQVKKNQLIRATTRSMGRVSTEHGLRRAA